MKHRKITALIFAVLLWLTTLTACTNQSAGKEEVTPTTAASSESQTEPRKRLLSRKSRRQFKA